MESHSALRRLDDTGRLIIPKPMRQVLRWQCGDPILLTLQNRNGLLLQSYPMMRTLRPVVADYADAFFSTYHVPIAICDRERYLVHRGFPLTGQPPSPPQTQTLLDMNCDGPIHLLPPIPLLEGSDFLITHFIPIQSHTSSIGYILLSDSSNSRNEALMAATQLLTRMIVSQL